MKERENETLQLLAEFADAINSNDKTKLKNWSEKVEKRENIFDYIKRIKKQQN